MHNAAQSQGIKDPFLLVIVIAFLTNHIEELQAVLSLARADNA